MSLNIHVYGMNYNSLNVVQNELLKYVLKLKKIFIYQCILIKDSSHIFNSAMM